MTLKEWFRKFHNRPLKIAAAFLLAVWFVFADRSYLVITEKHSSAVSQAADFLSITTQSKDRIMTESLLETLLSQGGASSAALCKGAQQIMSANQDLFGCKSGSLFFENVIEKKIPGSGDLVLRAKFNMLTSLSSILSILGFGFILVLAGFYFIQIAQNRIEKDILGPLLNKLLSDEKLEINELSDLQERTKKVQELEAQKAVTLAVHENNQQVAHDIRSPVAAINELLKLVEIKDLKLKGALDKAVARANSVANALLTHEKEASKQQVESAYDVAAVVQDIATEKRPLFVGGTIEVEAPKHLFATINLSMAPLARVLSNIVDNAMLACDDIKKIKISLKRDADSVVILVSDSGRGIPPEVLGRLGQKGVSYRVNSEESGSGRGVYSAKNTLNQAGGSIRFESATGTGTNVAIRIPIKALDPFETPDLVLVDNEQMIRMTWELGAAEMGLKCKTFASVEEMLASAEHIPRTTPVYVDSDLGDHKKGQDYGPLLREMAFERVFLATAYEHLHGTRIPGFEAVVGKSFKQAACTSGATSTPVPPLAASLL